MAAYNSDYHISLEWKSEESSSDDESPVTDSSTSSSELGNQHTPAEPMPCDGTMIESGSTLRNASVLECSDTRDQSPAPNSPALLATPQSELDPRGYQIELFRRARNENVIACMDTGTGKTLVAALLLRKTLEDLKAQQEAEQLRLTRQQYVDDSNVATDVEMTTDDQQPGRPHKGQQLSKKRTRDDPSDQLMVSIPKRLQRKARKITVFLVHRVALVPQQANYVERFLPAEDIVGAYYGEKGVDDWSSSRWARSLRSKSVLVMTAQIFLNLLRHGLVHIQDVALLIVDEVHHATKSHPYRRVFIEFYHTIKEGDPRPRIFGMTATPVKRKVSYTREAPYLTAMAELEATLDSTVVVVSGEGQKEIEALVPKPEEFVVTYKSHAESETEVLGEEDLEKESQILSRLEQLLTGPSEEHEGNHKNPNAVNQEMDTSGDADKEQTKSEDDVIMNGSLPYEDMELVKRIYRKLGYKAAADFATQLCRISHLSPDVTLRSLCEGCGDDEDLQKNSIPERVGKLLDIVCAAYLRTKTGREASEETTPGANRFQCIVFVQERSSALALTWVINSVFAPLKCQELVARSVVGAQNTKNVVRMSRVNLCNTIDDFKQGKYGILVSTSVVEEGLDIPACSLVVAFDPVVSPTSYIQGRGRARKDGARYIAFVEEGARGGYEGLLLARRGARMMAEVAKSNVKTEASRQMEEMKNLRAIVGREKTLFSKTTGARVSATESVNLLHRYCIMKAQNAQMELYVPKYVTSECDGGHIATVTLHSSISLDCGLSGEPQETVVLARRHAALDAYTKLYHTGEIDEYLLPRRLSRSQRTLMTRKPQGLGIRAFTQRNKQRIRREVASKASKKSKRVRICMVMNPKVVRNHVGEPNTEAEVEEEGDSSEKMYLYRISLTCDMSSQRWYPFRKDEKFGILVRDRIASEDEDVIQCPQGKPLFKLSFLKEVNLCPSLRNEATQYVRFLQLCLRGRAPGSEKALEIEKTLFANSGKEGFFLLPLTGDTSSNLDVNWENMERCTTYGWRCGPPELSQSTARSSLEHVILCSSHENLDRVYLTGSIRPDLTAEMHPAGFVNASYSSFVQYFKQRHKVDLKEPGEALLEGFSVREVVTNLSVSPFMLPLETCRVMPVSPLACFITSILPVWQTFLALRTCWRRNSVKGNVISFLTFARALQPNINNVAKKEADLSYERLEFLGDAVLKVVYSMVTFVKNPDDCEGLLSDERDLEVSNQRLADLGLKMRLQDCVAFSGVSQKAKSWPWYWGTHQNKSIRISEKVLADCVEALIGAHFLHGGVNLAVMFLDSHSLLPGASEILGLGIGHNTGDGVSIDVPPMGSGDRRYESAVLQKVEQVIGYKFRDRRHLVVALTHGSFENGLISSYQRYEYLGDAIIGFLLLSHYFAKYPDLSPGELTSIRGPALSNDLFARVVVSCGLHQTFWHNCPPLQKEIDKFAELFANEEEDDDDVSKSITVPKVLGDLLESIVGAIVVDKGMRLDGLMEIVLRIMDEELSRFANPEKFKYNPVSELVLLIQQNSNTRPRYKYLENADNLEKTCVITVNDFELGRGVGPTKRVAKRKASIAALEKVRQESKDAGGYMSSAICMLDQVPVGNRTSMA